MAVAHGVLCVRMRVCVTTIHSMAGSSWLVNDRFSANALPETLSALMQVCQRTPKPPPSLAVNVLPGIFSGQSTKSGCVRCESFGQVCMEW